MRGKVAKKIRQVCKRNWKSFLKELKAEPFGERFGIAWWLLFGKQLR